MAKEESVLTKEKGSAIVIPDPPELLDPAQPLPREVKEKWRKTYAEALKEAQRRNPDDQERQLADALYEANKIFWVEEPKDHKDAREIPDWQVMRRVEVDWKDVPLHVQHQIRKEDGRTSGLYLEVYAIDGRQYFFEVPESEPAKPKGKKKDDEAAA